MAVQMPIIGFIFVLMTKVFLKTRKDRLPPIHVNLKVELIIFTEACSCGLIQIVFCNIMVLYVILSTALFITYAYFEVKYAFLRIFNNAYRFCTSSIRIHATYSYR